MRSIKIGKDANNDVIISNSTVSRQHAIVTIANNGNTTIRDLNSTNGTYVNGKRITGENILKPGDKVQLGNHLATYEELTTPTRKEETKVNKPSGHIQLPQGIKEMRRIGRDSSMQICFNQNDVSKHHATLCQLHTGDVVIVDMNSTNGTFVNGQRISEHQTLHKGDIVLLAGKYKLEWEQIFKASTPKPKVKWSHIAAACFLLCVIGVGVKWWIDHRILDPSAIYGKYKKTVVMIYEETGYKVTVDNAPLSSHIEWLKEFDYCHLDEKGNYKSGIQGSTGTGFFISSDGKIMTNKHVILPVGEETKHAEIIQKKMSADLLTAAYKAVDSDQKLAQKLAYISENLEVKHDIIYLGIMRNDTYVSGKSDMTPCSLYKASNDDNVDLAIIQTNTKQTPDDVENLVKVKEASEYKGLELGDKIYSIGFPLSFTIGETETGLEANNQSGEVTQERGEFTYGHNITIHHGASGSPVFDARGEFAGVVVSGFLGVSQGYNHAIQPKKAAELIQ